MTLSTATPDKIECIRRGGLVELSKIFSFTNKDNFLAIKCFNFSVKGRFAVLALVKPYVDSQMRRDFLNHFSVPCPKKHLPLVDHPSFTSNLCLTKTMNLLGRKLLFATVLPIKHRREGGSQGNYQGARGHEGPEAMRGPGKYTICIFVFNFPRERLLARGSSGILSLVFTHETNKLPSKNVFNNLKEGIFV